MKGELYMSAEIMVDFANASLGYIKADLEDLKKGFVKLGFHLREMRNLEYYYYVPRIDGEGCYEDFYEMCFECFGISRSTVSRLIDINMCVTGTGDGSGRLRSCWQG